MPTKKTQQEETPKSEQFKVYGHELLKKVKELIKKGNIQRIIIKDEKGKVMMEIPMTFAAVAAVAAPLLAAIGALAALMNKCTLEVIKKK
ncbi:MAG: DUF4342 domain-containing protein [Patescibacteria group bacterium]|jgi:hypothetical protein